MNIAVFEQSSLHPDALNLLRQSGHTLIPVTSDNLKLNPEIECLFIQTYTQVDKQLLHYFPQVKYVLRSGVGLDNVDVAYCKTKGIQVFNSPGSNANAVVEYVLGTMFHTLRQVDVQRQLLNQGQWRASQYLGRELKNQTVGIVGCGAIGQLLAKNLKNLGVKSILGFDPFKTAEDWQEIDAQPVSWTELISNADIISLHMPLTVETRGLIGLSELRQMKPSAYVINTARGGILNEDDLIIALERNWIAGAVLDVFETEPQVKDRLLKMNTILATPHIAGYTKEAQRAMAVQVAERFLAQLQLN
jgi:D-3-phosphoglycerate dehydrogenase